MSRQRLEHRGHVGEHLANVFGCDVNLSRAVRRCRPGVLGQVGGWGVLSETRRGIRPRKGDDHPALVIAVKLGYPRQQPLIDGNRGSSTAAASWAVAHDVQAIQARQHPPDTARVGMRDLGLSGSPYWPLPVSTPCPKGRTGRRLRTSWRSPRWPSTPAPGMCHGTPRPRPRCRAVAEPCNEPRGGPCGHPPPLFFGAARRR